MKRSSFPVFAALAAVLAGVIALLSNIIASDLWERVKSQSWYSLTRAGLALCILTAIGIVIAIWRGNVNSYVMACAWEAQPIEIVCWCMAREILRRF